MEDWHKQVWIIFKQFLHIQQFLIVMKWNIVINRIELSKTYTILLPIMVMMGDMPFLNKMVGMVGGLHHEPICQMHNIQCNDAPY